MGIHYGKIERIVTDMKRILLYALIGIILMLIEYYFFTNIIGLLSTNILMILFILISNFWFGLSCVVYEIKYRD